MTLEQLTEIIRTVDQKTITKRLHGLSYTFCNKDKKLQKLPIETLFKGEIVETETFPDRKSKRTYQGGIFTQVQGYEQFEFVVVNVNDHKNVFPIDMLIWAKEIQ